MAEENNEAVEANEEEKMVENSKGEEVEELRARLEAAEERAKKYDVVNGKYLNDPKFKESFDAAWAGKQLEREVARVEASVDNEEDPTSMLKRELDRANRETQALKQKIDNLEGTYVEDKNLSVSRDISLQYEDDFREMAESAGYKHGTEAYDLLFTKATKEGYNIARELGLNHPLQKYNKKVVSKAFDRSLDAMKKAGFDEAVQKRNQMVKESKENKQQSDGPSLDKFFTKERLKERGGAAKAMEEAFRARFNRDDIKM